jgi:hypothetical protein
VSGPVRCKKSECQKASVDDVGLIEVKHPGLEEGGVLFTVIVTRAIGGHMIDVSYMDVYQEILDFFKKRFSK